MSRFSAFTRFDNTYRMIGDVPLEATILVPSKTLDSPKQPGKKRPLIIRWHGGGFVVGHRMYECWFARWLLELALDVEAIIVTPDYRLLPESTGADILNDVAHFWTWAERSLPGYMKENELPAVDVGHVLCCGESSGGFISVYCALNLASMIEPPNDNTEQLQITAVISISAPLDATAPEYKIPRPRIFMGRQPPPPRQALAKIRGYVNGIRPGTIRTGCEPTAEMWELLLCIAQQAYLPRLFGRGVGEGRPAIERLRETLDMNERAMVPLWVVHWSNDTMVRQFLQKDTACSS